jgi:hypothetical protein
MVSHTGGPVLQVPFRTPEWIGGMTRSRAFEPAPKCGASAGAPVEHGSRSRGAGGWDHRALERCDGARERARRQSDARPSESPIPTPRSPFTLPWGDWPAALALIAMFGTFALLDLRVLSFVWTAWIARGAHAVEDPRLLALLAGAAESIGLARRVTLKLTDRFDVPAVACCVRPVLLLPAEALEWSEARLHSVFLHELAHLRRRDEIGFAIARAATALLWFHPLVWTMARLSREECERACDDAVLLAGVRPSDYADHLLAIARGATRFEGWSSMSLAFASPSSLEGRLVSILRPNARRRPMSKRAMLAVTVALGVLLVPFAVLSVVAQPYSASSTTSWPDASVDEPARARRPRPTPSPRRRRAMSIRTPTRTRAHRAVDENEALTADREWNDLGPESARSGDEWYAQAMAEYGARRYDMAGESVRARGQGRRELRHGLVQRGLLLGADRSHEPSPGRAAGVDGQRLRCDEVPRGRRRSGRDALGPPVPDAAGRRATRSRDGGQRVRRTPGTRKRKTMAGRRWTPSTSTIPIRFARRRSR